jgi:excisionase family DNA binding protein
MDTPRAVTRQRGKAAPPAPLAHSINGTCDQLGVGRTKIYDLISRGDLETVRIGSRRLVTHRSLEALLDRYRVV